VSEREEVFAHVVEAWLDSGGETEDPARVLDAVLDAFEATPQQRPSRLPLPRSPRSWVTTVGLAAAVLVFAIFATSLLSTENVLEPPSGVPSNGWIVYSTKSVGSGISVGDLNVVRPGTEPRHLLANGEPNDCPAFSPDGTRLAYRTGNELIVVEFTDSGSLGQVVTRHDLARRLPGLCPIWSPDSTRLAAATDDGILLVNLDGTDSTVAVSDFSFGVDYVPTWGWSPAGDMIAAATTRGILLVQLDGSVRVLVPGSLPHALVWSPDGTRIAFAQQQSLGPGIPDEIHVVDLDPSVDELNLGIGSNPVWSPDGDRIAFVGDGCAFVVAVVGGSTRDESGQSVCAYAIGPWSPDGQWILYQQDVGGTIWDLGAVSSDASTRQVISPAVLTASLRNYPGFPGDVTWQTIFETP